MGKRAKSLTHYLAEWREHRGLTQDQVAERAEISKTVLSRLENYERPLREDHMIALAHAYSCEPWELIGRNPLIEPEPVVSLWDKIAKEKRDAALQMLTALADGDTQKRA